MVASVGETSVEPLNATSPTPLSIDTLVAFVVSHERVEGVVNGTVSGVAVKNSMVGAGGVSTVILEVSDFPSACAVTVKVPSDDGVKRPSGSMVPPPSTDQVTGSGIVIVSPYWSFPVESN